MESRSGKSFVAFEGIPFAKPPIGNLRFKDPESPDRWDGIRDALTPGQECLQYDSLFMPGTISGSEDCLYLSVYTPDVIFSNLLPVLVYIHGGAYEFGQGQTFHGPEYLLDEKIVLVSINYRLGPFGFLSFEDEELPGNMGMKDQQLALTWVKENIAFFGGHPKKVTILGESAGGSSVSLHIVSPSSRGLFHRGISISGNAYTPWALVRPGVARERAIRTAQDAGCPYTDTRATLDCLRTKNGTAIVSLRQLYTDELRDPVVYYAPVVDSKSERPFLPDFPEKLTHAPVPWIIGISSGDGLLKTAIFTVTSTFSWNALDSELSDYIRTNVLFGQPVAGDDMLTDEIRQFYFNSGPLSDESFENMTNMVTDAAFWYPTMEAIERHKGPVYLYYFDYLGNNSFLDLLGSRRMIYAAFHTDELIYLFNTTAFFPPLTGNDLAVSQSLVKLWTTFVKTGSPNAKDSILNWQPWQPIYNDYLHIHSKGYTMGTDLLRERGNFWKYLSSKYNL